jgi:hypothetical protein
MSSQFIQVAWMAKETSIHPPVTAFSDPQGSRTSARREEIDKGAPEQIGLPGPRLDVRSSTNIYIHKSSGHRHAPAMPAGTMHASGMDNKPFASTYVAHAFAGKIRRPRSHIIVRRATDI